MLSRLVVALFLTATLVAQDGGPLQEPQPTPHNPVACARRDGFRGGARVHACTCVRMGVPDDGEGCAPGLEDRKCLAYCRRDLCACPIECDITEPQH